MSYSETRDRVLKAALACQPSLTAYAYSMLSDFPAAQDVVQDAFVIVARKYEDFEEGTSMNAWCRAIVRLRVLELLRKNRREQLVEDRILQDSIDAAFESNESNPEMRCRIDKLYSCLAKLPDRAREIIRMRYEDNAAYTEIGDALGIKIEAVRKSLFRTKRQLTACVRNQIKTESN